MLSVNNYAKEYIDRCRRNVHQQLAAYKELVVTAEKRVGTHDKKMASALASFEPLFFNNMVLVLDNYFCHRSRTIEGKDGNPLNEVRVLCNALTQNQGVVAADKSIKLKPESSVLKLRVGDPVGLNAADFSLLSEAFFDEIERKYL